MQLDWSSCVQGWAANAQQWEKQNMRVECVSVAARILLGLLSWGSSTGATAKPPCGRPPGCLVYLAMAPWFTVLRWWEAAGDCLGSWRAHWRRQRRGRSTKAFIDLKNARHALLPHLCVPAAWAGGQDNTAPVCLRTLPRSEAASLHCHTRQRPPDIDHAWRSLRDPQAAR